MDAYFLLGSNGFKTSGTNKILLSSIMHELKICSAVFNFPRKNCVSCFPLDKIVVFIIIRQNLNPKLNQAFAWFGGLFRIFGALPQKRTEQIRTLTKEIYSKQPTKSSKCLIYFWITNGLDFSMIG